MPTAKTILSRDGTIIILEGFLQELNLREGDELFITERNEELVITTKLARIRKAPQLFREWFPIEPGRSLGDELLAERRAEAMSEQEAGRS